MSNVTSHGVGLMAKFTDWYGENLLFVSGNVKKNAYD
jgi:hypothetical protein